LPSTGEKGFKKETIRVVEKLKRERDTKKKKRVTEGGANPLRTKALERKKGGHLLVQKGKGEKL